MKKVITIKGVQIGAGMPKICIPLMGKKRADILKNLTDVMAAKPDIIEWRADDFEGVLEKQSRNGMLEEIVGIIDRIPFLFTVRTKAEGGNLEIADENYRQLLKQTADETRADLIDVEYQRAGDCISYLHEKKAVVVASNHEFQKTPPKKEIEARLQRMQLMDADIVKIAVMPQNIQDVLELLMATADMKERGADRPVVTMSMGKLGVISRFSGEIFGSDITFAAAGETSAPGQMDYKSLKTMLKMIHTEGTEDEK